jgi:hypothetical protein
MMINGYMVNDSGLGYPSYVDPLTLIEPAAPKFRLTNQQAAESCGEDERGHPAKVAGKEVSGLAAHMAYKQDGFYVAAAACYIKKQFDAAGGAAPAAVAVASESK